MGRLVLIDCLVYPSFVSSIFLAFSLLLGLNFFVSIFQGYPNFSHEPLLRRINFNSFFILFLAKKKEKMAESDFVAKLNYLCVDIKRIEEFLMFSIEIYKDP